jgi:hypothetical protein
MIPLYSHAYVFLYFIFFFICNEVLKIVGLVDDNNIIILALLVWLVRLRGAWDKLQGNLYKNPELTATQLMMEGIHARTKHQSKTKK